MKRECSPDRCVTIGALAKFQHMISSGYQSIVCNRMVPQTQDDVVGENKKSGNDETLDILRGQRSTQPLPVDPDELGLVPAFVVGDVFAAELCGYLHRPDVKPPDVNVLQMIAKKSGLPTPPGMVLMQASGRLGNQSGNVGFFAEQSAAQISGFQAFADVGHSKHAGIDIKEEADLRAGKASWDQPDRYQLVKALGVEILLIGGLVQFIRALRYPLATALDLAQRHPGVHLAHLDMQDKAVMNAVQASATQHSQWHGDDAVVQGVKPGLLAYTLPGIHLDLPTTYGPFRFSPVFTNWHFAERLWRSCNLAGVPSLEERPLAETVAQVRAQNKASLGTQAATFKSFINANILEQGQQDKYFASLSEVEIQQPRMSRLQCVLEPGLSVPMRIAVGLIVNSTIEALRKHCLGANVPAKWAAKLSSPVELPIVPLDLQHRLGQQPMASTHLDHAMARRVQRAVGDMPSSATITQPPSVAGHGLLLIGDVRPERMNTMRPEQDADMTRFTMNFNNLAAVQ